MYEPLYSALETLGINPFTAIDNGSLVNQKYDNSGYIKPLTDVYLRGCNLDNCVVILEETQNTEFHLLKKILTRVCKNTKVICIGHEGQIDLPNKDSSGFVKYIEWFKICSRTLVTLVMGDSLMFIGLGLQNMQINLDKVR